MASERAADVRNFCGLVILKEFGESNEALPEIDKKYFCLQDTRDADFKKIENRLAYIYKFGSFNILCMEKCITNFITQNLEAKNIFTSKKLKICSLSNGPGIDIIGFLLAIFNSNLQLNFIPSLNVISATNSWQDTFKTCLRTAGHSLNSKYTFFCQIPNFIHCDIYSTLSPEVETCIAETDILLMHNVFASSKATTDVFTNTLKTIFTLLKPGSVVFYIGSKKKTKDISEENFVKNFVNCIFGPTKVAYEDLPFNQDTVSSIDIANKQFGQVFFIAWQKKLDVVENEVLVSKSARKRRKKKNKTVIIQSENIGNESLVNDMKDYETDANSEMSCASSSIQSDTSQTSISQCDPFSSQDKNSNNSGQDNRNISVYFQSLLESTNKNDLPLKENKVEHEDLLFKHAYQNGIFQITCENSQHEKHSQKEVDMSKDITEINLDEIKNKTQIINESQNISEIKTDFSTEQYCLVPVQENVEIAHNLEKQSNVKIPIFQEYSEINFACNKDLDMGKESQNCAVRLPREDTETELGCNKEESDVKKESQNCTIPVFQEHTENELAGNKESDVKKETLNYKGNAEIELAYNKDYDVKKETQKCVIPMLQENTKTRLEYNKEESDIKKENQNYEENVETKLACNKKEESNTNESQKGTVRILEENTETKLVFNVGNEPNANRGNQNYAIPVLQENVETKLTYNETQFKEKKTQNKSSNTNDVKDSYAKAHKSVNGINERVKVLKNAIQSSAIQSTNIQKIPIKINAASANNTICAGKSSDICVNPLHPLEAESSSFTDGCLQNFIQSSGNMPISRASDKMKPKIQKDDLNMSKTKKVFLHKAVDTSRNKLDNQIEEHILQNKMPNLIDKEKSHSQSFETMFKNCESLVNVLEGLITSIKEDERLKNERALNERNCCCTLIEQKARFANSCCMLCCSCMACAHCPCRNICSCTTINCMSCYPKCYSEANNIATPSIVIPLKNENLLQILRTLSLENTN